MPWSASGSRACLRRDPRSERPTAATRYALPTHSVAAILGYTLKSQSAVLPAAVLDQIPAGPPLSPTAATNPAATG